MKKKIYLCHPYSHPDSEVMHQRFLSANDLAARLIRAGHVVFSPISHSVPIADEMGNHKDHDYWLIQDLVFVEWANEIWVPLVDGWCDSHGIAREEARAYVLDKPIVYFVPEGEHEIRICSTQEMFISMADTRKAQSETAGDGGVLEVFP